MRTYSLPTKVIAMLTAVGLVGLGCAGAEDADVGADPGSREVSLEVWTNLADDSGTRTKTSMGSTTATLDELQAAQRALVIDGEESSDLARVRSGSEIVVPLNTGETATLKRDGDRLELVSFTGEDDGTGDLPRGAVSAVRLLDDGVDVFLTGSKGDAPDTSVRVSGIEDLDAERGALVTSLALRTILVSLEEEQQFFDPITMTLQIAAAVAVAWWAVCGATVWDCASECWTGSGIEVKCGGLRVSTNPWAIDFSGEHGCRCL
jgi:hypothetical protein